MNAKNISIGFIGFLFAFASFKAMAGEIIHFSAAEVQNIVSQQLTIATSKHDYKALQEAKDCLPAIVISNGKTIYRHVTPEQSFLLRLQILKVAEVMRDKSFDPKTRTTAGIYGKVPWPKEKDRPQSLVGKPLWVPGQNPEDFRESNPALYAVYKPLYEENQRNTEKHKREGRIRSIRNDIVREVRNALTTASHDENDPQRHSRYVALVKKMINDEALQQCLLSDKQSDDTSVK